MNRLPSLSTDNRRYFLVDLREVDLRAVDFLRLLPELDFLRLEVDFLRLEADFLRLELDFLRLLLELDFLRLLDLLPDLRAVDFLLLELLLRLDLRAADFLREDFFAGTLPPSLRASDRPIAIACSLLLTVLPEPLFSLPRLRSCIARLTLSCAFLPYFAISDPLWGS